MTHCPMTARLLTALLLMALVGGTSSCESLYDAATDEIFGSDRERREKHYRNKGVSKKKARRMAFEDEVWGDL